MKLAIRIDGVSGATYSLQVEAPDDIELAEPLGRRTRQWWAAKRRQEQLTAWRKLGKIRRLSVKALCGEQVEIRGWPNHSEPRLCDL